MDKKTQRRKTMIIIGDIVFGLLYTLLITAAVVLWGLVRLVDGLNFVFFPFLFIIFAIVGLAFIIFLYIKNNPVVLDRKKEKKYVLILSLTVAVLSISGITGIEIKNYDLKTYTREKWLERGYDRGRLVTSFMKKVDLVGKTESDVIYYLGEPDYQGKPSGNDTFAFSYNYDIGLYFDFLDPSTFDVYFNESGIITSVSIGYH